MTERGPATRVSPQAAKRRRLVRAGSILAAMTFGAFAIAAMASKNPKDQASGLQQITTPLVGDGTPAGPPSSGAAGSSNPGGVPAAPSDTSALAGGSGVGNAGGSSPANSAAAASAGDSGQSAGSAGSTTGSGAGSGAGPSTPTSNSKVAVVSGLLSTSSFATKSGVPLLCGVAASATGPFAANQQMADVVATITSTCNQLGNQGTTTITALNQQLAALAAINPAVDPLLDQLAATFNQAGSNQTLPFVATLAYFVQLVQFFHG
jgi:hypothetical protein